MAATRYDSAAKLHAAVAEWARQTCKYPSSDYTLKAIARRVLPNREKQDALSKLAAVEKSLRRLLVLAPQEAPARGIYLDGMIPGEVQDSANELLSHVSKARDRLQKLPRLIREQGPLVQLIDGLGGAKASGKQPLLEYLTAAAVRAGLTKDDDDGYQSLFTQAERNKRTRGGHSRGESAMPTLKEGIEVTRKKVDKTLRELGILTARAP
jgi:hypothetical protein